MNTEILVHITAPSTVHHDKRYRAIARGVAEFKAGTLIKVTSPDIEAARSDDASARESSPQDVSSLYQSGTHVPAIQTLEVSQTRKRKRKYEFYTDYASLQESRVLDSFVSGDNRADGQCPEEGGCTDTIRTKRFRHPSIEIANRSSRTTKQNLESNRPRTAPASISITTPVLIPCTEHSARRRALSDSFSFGSNETTVPNSQPSLLELTGFVIPGNLTLGSDKGNVLQGYSPLTACDKKTTQPGHIRLLAEDSTANPKVTSHNCDFDADEGSKEPLFLLQDQSLSQVTQADKSRSTTSISAEIATPTATPSQPEEPTRTRNVGNRSDAEPHPQSSPINLVSDSSALPSQQLDDALSLSQCSQDSIILNDQDLQAARIAQSIDKLDWKIDSPTASYPDGRFMTDLTSRLREYDKCRPIKEHFLPVKVMRDVRVLERGFWQIPITVADWSEVEEWRRLNTILREGPVTLKYQYSPWTTEEFFAFYRRLGDDIRSGHLGSVRLFRVEDYVGPSKEVVGTGRVILRLYTWGESIGHIYMAMRWLSESKIEYVPASWIGSNGRTVITMSGERYRRKVPRLGQWIRKGGQGEQGKYGLAGEEG